MNLKLAGHRLAGSACFPLHMNRLQRTRLVYVLYAVAPLVSGLDSILYGRLQAGVLYLMLGLLFAVMLFFVKKLPWQNSRILQTAGAVMLITISFDMFRQGRNIVPYLYIFAAVLNVYVLYAGDTVQREKRKVNR